MDPLHQLFEHGQSYWRDNLTRQMIASGELKRRVHDEGLRGVTSNPAIFHKAISQSVRVHLRDEPEAALHHLRIALPSALSLEATTV